MGRRTVVSGGGTGIGAAIAEVFAKAGDEVLILGRRAEVLEGTAKRLNDAGGHVTWHAADLTDPEQVAEAAELAGDTDVLVNNAGGNLAATPAASLTETRDQWLTNLSGNVLPVVLPTQALLPRLRRPGGRIITISSIAAFRGAASYGAAKAALHPWSIELADRLAPEGVTVNVIAPGFVPDTEFYRERGTPEFFAGRAAAVPAGRGGTPAEIAALVAHLASAEAGFLTGQVIGVNGGAWPGTK
ncbi:3-oxoacyl-ACP reductase [Actinorhabdospora filicis]|uniref:3-oxoacyl-ACP reductase n=1 Tax=Actinorhabdospora filicis TaxID=1785913 RepID=A0A9W6W3K6_9ACTN|nr:SDR family oxidoreductase [Actinorhabdospora filicis]GLZ78262.1 3-oxoacyl-ACP reductase [Actinorhabdospora filicis]